MRPGTLMLVVAANAIIAVGIVAVAITAFPSSPEPFEAPVTEARDAFDPRPLQTEIAELKRKVTVLEGVSQTQGRALAAAKTEVAELRDKLANADSSDLPADASPEEVAAEKATREAGRQMIRGMAAGARAMGRRQLEALANPTEQSIQQRERMIRMGVSRLASSLNLTDTRKTRIEQKLLDVDRRSREQMKAAIDAKGIDNITYDDAKPLVDQSFKEREEAMAGELDEKEMETFRAQEQQARRGYDMLMRMAFPAKPAEGGDGK